MKSEIHNSSASSEGPVRPNDASNMDTVSQGYTFVAPAPITRRRFAQKLALLIGDQPNNPIDRSPDSAHGVSNIAGEDA